MIIKDNRLRMKINDSYKAATKMRLKRAVDLEYDSGYVFLRLNARGDAVVILRNHFVNNKNIRRALKFDDMADDKIDVVVNLIERKLTEELLTEVQNMTLYDGEYLFVDASDVLKMLLSHDFYEKFTGVPFKVNVELASDHRYKHYLTYDSAASATFSSINLNGKRYPYNSVSTTTEFQRELLHYVRNLPVSNDDAAALGMVNRSIAIPRRRNCYDIMESVMMLIRGDGYIETNGTFWLPEQNRRGFKVFNHNVDFQAIKSTLNQITDDRFNTGFNILNFSPLLNVAHFQQHGASIMSKDSSDCYDAIRRTVSIRIDDGYEAEIDDFYKFIVKNSIPDNISGISTKPDMAKTILLEGGKDILFNYAALLMTYPSIISMIARNQGLINLNIKDATGIISDRVNGNSEWDNIRLINSAAVLATAACPLKDSYTPTDVTNDRFIRGISYINAVASQRYTNYLFRVVRRVIDMFRTNDHISIDINLNVENGVYKIEGYDGDFHMIFQHFKGALNDPNNAPIHGIYEVHNMLANKIEVTKYENTHGKLHITNPCLLPDGYRDGNLEFSGSANDYSFNTIDFSSESNGSDNDYIIYDPHTTSYGFVNDDINYIRDKIAQGKYSNLIVRGTLKCYYDLDNNNRWSLYSNISKGSNGLLPYCYAKPIKDDFSETVFSKLMYHHLQRLIDNGLIIQDYKVDGNEDIEDCIPVIERIATSDLMLDDLMHCKYVRSWKPNIVGVGYADGFMPVALVKQSDLNDHGFFDGDEVTIPLLFQQLCAFRHLKLEVLSELSDAINTIVRNGELMLTARSITFASALIWKDGMSLYEYLTSTDSTNIDIRAADLADIASFIDAQLAEVTANEVIANYVPLIINALTDNNINKLSLVHDIKQAVLDCEYGVSDFINSMQLSPEVLSLTRKFIDSKVLKVINDLSTIITSNPNLLMRQDVILSLITADLDGVVVSPSDSTIVNDSAPDLYTALNLDSNNKFYHCGTVSDTHTTSISYTHKYLSGMFGIIIDTADTTIGVASKTIAHGIKILNDLLRKFLKPAAAIYSIKTNPKGNINVFPLIIRSGIFGNDDTLATFKHWFMLSEYSSALCVNNDFVVEIKRIPGTNATSYAVYGCLTDSEVNSIMQENSDINVINIGASVISRVINRLNGTEPDPQAIKESLGAKINDAVKTCVKQTITKNTTGAVVGGLIGGAIGCLVGAPWLGAVIGAGIGTGVANVNSLANVDEAAKDAWNESIIFELDANDLIANQLDENGITTIPNQDWFIKLNNTLFSGFYSPMPPRATEGLDYDGLDNFINVNVVLQNTCNVEPVFIPKNFEDEYEEYKNQLNLQLGVIASCATVTMLSAVSTSKRTKKQSAGNVNRKFRMRYKGNSSYDAIDDYSGTLLNIENGVNHNGESIINLENRFTDDDGIISGTGKIVKLLYDETIRKPNT